MIVARLLIRARILAPRHEARKLSPYHDLAGKTLAVT
jgi:hypothetical protein